MITIFESWKYIFKRRQQEFLENEFKYHNSVMKKKSILQKQPFMEA